MFDDIIRGKANEHEAPVPPGAWDNIARQKKKRRFGFWWRGGGVLLLACLLTSGYFISKEKNSETIVAENKTKPVADGKRNEAIAETVMPVAPNGYNKQPVANNDGQPGLPMATNENENVGTRAVKGNLSTTVASPLPDEAAGAINGKNGKKANEGKPLLAANGKQRKKTKGKTAFSNKAATPEEINNAAETKNATAETTIALQNEETKNIAANNSTKTATQIGKNLPDTKESKPATGSKKENTAPTKPKNKKHWFIEAAAVPLIASTMYNKNIPFIRTLTENNTVSVYKANLKSASIEPAVALCFFVRTQISKKLDAGMGMQYMLLKENLQIEGKETTTTNTIVQRLANGQLLPDTVATVSEGTRSVNATNSYELFSIPLFLQYNIIENEQWSLGAVGGFYFNISSNYKDEINRNAVAPLQGAPGTRGKNSTGVDIFAGMRIGKKLSRRLDIFAMPSIRLGLAKYNVKNGLLDKNINQGGVGFGLCYIIK